MAGGELIVLPDFLKIIFDGIRGKSIAKEAIPEQFTILRSFQIVNEFKDKII